MIRLVVYLIYWLVYIRFKICNECYGCIYLVFKPGLCAADGKVSKCATLLKAFNVMLKGIWDSVVGDNEFVFSKRI